MSVASIVDWDALLTVVWVSFAAGVGASSAFGLAILGGARALHLGREGRASEATLFGLLGALAVVAVFAAIAAGVALLSE
jgi:hypothetical protein